MTAILLLAEFSVHASLFSFLPVFRVRQVLMMSEANIGTGLLLVLWCTHVLCWAFENREHSVWLCTGGWVCVTSREMGMSSKIHVATEGHTLEQRTLGFTVHTLFVWLFFNAVWTSQVMGDVLTHISTTKVMKRKRYDWSVVYYNFDIYMGRLSKNMPTRGRTGYLSFFDQLLLYGGRDSSVNIVTMLWAGRPGFDSQQG
jgi:hypothetical protein